MADERARPAQLELNWRSRPCTKVARAEPIAALYEQGCVHHLGVFTELEDQLCSYVGGDGPSPDRYDALVWALTELAVKDEPGLLTMYRNEVARRAAAKAAGQG